MKTKKIPLRKCLGCGELFDKRTLIRVVKNKEDEVFLDLTGKKNGRGAYLCKSVDCYKKAVKRKSIERALSISISEEIYNELLKELEDAK